MTVIFVMGLAFLIHGVGVLAIGRLWGSVPALWRVGAAGLLAAVYTALCVFDSRFGASGWRLVSLLAVSMVAFGGAWKQWVAYLLLFLSVEGAAVLLGERWGWIGAFLPLLLPVLLQRAAPARRYIPVELRFGDTRVKLTALVDTGNTLRDPVTGLPVLVLDGKTSCSLTGLSDRQLRSPLEVMRQPPIPGLRLIPYRAVGVAGGLLLGLRLQTVRIGGRRCSLMVAFAPELFCESGEFQALAGGIL